MTNEVIPAEGRGGFSALFFSIPGGRVFDFAVCACFGQQRVLKERLRPRKAFCCQLVYQAGLKVEDKKLCFW